MNTQIVSCVLCSHRLFAGMSHAGIPIRDFSSLAKLTQDGIFGLGTMEDDESILHRSRVIEKERFSAADMDNYLSAEPMFFKMFTPFMRPVSRLVRCDGVTVARETFTYELDGDEWIAHMSSLGFARLEDERKKLTRPLTGTDLTEALKISGFGRRRRQHERASLTKS